MASEKGHEEVVKSLLSAGADANHENDVCDIYDYYNEEYFFKFFCNMWNDVVL